MAITITHYASNAKYGDMCIVDINGKKIMIDGGKTDVDARLLSQEIGKSTFLSMIISHWHEDHWGYLLFNQKPMAQKTCYGNNLPEIVDIDENNDVFIDTRKIFNLNNISPYFNNSECYASNINTDDENDNSLVTVIREGNINYFSFGDATRDAIQTDNSYQDVFASINSVNNPIIKLPHHGSLDNNGYLFDNKFNNINQGSFIISGYGGYQVSTIMKKVLEKGHKLYWVVKDCERDFKGSSFFNYLQNSYGDRFIVSNQVTVNNDGEIQ